MGSLNNQYLLSYDFCCRTANLNQLGQMKVGEARLTVNDYIRNKKQVFRRIVVLLSFVSISVSVAGLLLCKQFSQPAGPTVAVLVLALLICGIRIMEWGSKRLKDKFFGPLQELFGRDLELYAAITLTDREMAKTISQVLSIPETHYRDYLPIVTIRSVSVLPLEFLDAGQRLQQEQMSSTE